MRLPLLAALGAALLIPPSPASAAGKTQPMMVLAPRGGTLSVSRGAPGRVKSVCLDKAKAAPTQSTSFSRFTSSTGQAPVPTILGVRRNGTRVNIGPVGSNAANEHVVLTGVDARQAIAEELARQMLDAYVQKPGNTLTADQRRQIIPDLVERVLKDVPEEVSGGTHTEMEFRVTESAEGFDSYKVVFAEKAFVAEEVPGDLTDSGLARSGILRELPKRLAAPSKIPSRERLSLLQRETWLAGRLEQAGVTLVRSRGWESMSFNDFGDLLVPGAPADGPLPSSRLDALEKIVDAMTEALDRPAPAGVDRGVSRDQHLAAWAILGDLSPEAVGTAAEVVGARRESGVDIAARLRDGGQLDLDIADGEVVVVSLEDLDGAAADGLMDAIAAGTPDDSRVYYAARGERSVPRLAAAHGGGDVQVVGDSSFADPVFEIENRETGYSQTPDVVLGRIGDRVARSTSAKVRVLGGHQDPEQRLDALVQAAGNGTNGEGRKEILAMCNLKNGEHVRLARVLLDNGAEAVVIPREEVTPDATFFVTAEVATTPWEDGSGSTVLDYWKGLHRGTAERIEASLKEKNVEASLRTQFPALPEELLAPGGPYIEAGGQPTRLLKDLPKIIRREAGTWELLGARRVPAAAVPS